jgi:hypothetical protein
VWESRVGEAEEAVVVFVVIVGDEEGGIVRDENRCDLSGDDIVEGTTGNAFECEETGNGTITEGPD